MDATNQIGAGDHIINNYTGEALTIKRVESVPDTSARGGRRIVYTLNDRSRWSEQLLRRCWNLT